MGYILLLFYLYTLVHTEVSCIESTGACPAHHVQDSLGRCCGPFTEATPLDTCVLFIRGEDWNWDDWLGFFGPSDTYVEAWASGGHVGRTSRKDDDRSPEWNERLCAGYVSGDWEVKVMDYDNLGSDEENCKFFIVGQSTEIETTYRCEGSKPGEVTFRYEIRRDCVGDWSEWTACTESGQMKSRSYLIYDIGRDASPCDSSGDRTARCPTYKPTRDPTKMPTMNPTFSPSASPSNIPSRDPSRGPSVSPSRTPSRTPSTTPTFNPTFTLPSYMPSLSPTNPCAAIQVHSDVFADEVDGFYFSDPFYEGHHYTFIRNTSLEASIYFDSANASWVLQSPLRNFFLPYTGKIPVRQDLWTTEDDQTLIVVDCLDGHVQLSTANKTWFPTVSPTVTPSILPSAIPSPSPSFSSPSRRPTTSPTLSPTTDVPSKAPSQTPSSNPSFSPSVRPTFSPSRAPTVSPSFMPSVSPSSSPSISPHSSTATPSQAPTKQQCGERKIIDAALQAEGLCDSVYIGAVYGGQPMERIDICKCLLFFNSSYVGSNYDCYLLQTSNNTILEEWVYCNATYNVEELFRSDTGTALTTSDSSEDFVTAYAPFIGGAFIFCCCVFFISRICFLRGKKANEIPIASKAEEGYTASMEMIAEVSPEALQIDVDSPSSPGFSPGSSFPVGPALVGEEGEMIKRKDTPNSPIRNIVGELYESKDLYASTDLISEGENTTSHTTPKQDIIPRSSIEYGGLSSAATDSTSKRRPDKLDVNAPVRFGASEVLLSPDSDDQGLYKSMKSIESEDAEGIGVSGSKTRSTASRGGEYTPSTHL